MTLSHLQGHSALQAFSNVIHFIQLCSSWQDFYWHVASRGPSAV